MEREKAQFDVLGKIEEERAKRGWTEYQLAKNAGIAQSTISTWYRKQLSPSVASIEKVCRGFGITLAEFFQDEEHNAVNGMSQDQYELYLGWARLNSRQKSALVEFVKTIEG